MKRRTPPGTSREKLLDAAIELFGRRGFDGVSTREIAARAGVNIAGIVYNFGGKEDLYRACVKHIAGALRAGLVNQTVRAGPQPETMTPDTAAAALHSIATAFVRFLLATPRLDQFARIIVREQMDPSPAFETLFLDAFEPMHRRICKLWSMATGEDENSETAKLTTFGVLGQVVLFRIAQAGTLRRLGWQSLGEKELAAIEASVRASLDLAIAHHRKGSPS
jgi:TetR/AcrR family transcriptional regulator, regulator of cefoperazone and chloramphenicol sensitivity